MAGRLTGGSAHWPPWGFLGSLGPALGSLAHCPLGPAGLLGAVPTESPCPLGSLVGLLHLALLAPGLTGTWRGLRTGRLGAAKSRADQGSNAHSCMLYRKVLIGQ